MNIESVVSVYLNAMKIFGRSYYTVKSARSCLGRFAMFLKEVHMDDMDELTTDVLRSYQEELFYSVTAKGKPLAIRTQAQHMGVIKGFTRYLKDNDYMVHDPGDKIKLPKKPRTLPKVILSENEIKKMFNAVDIRSNRGYRNRVVLEVLYDTAIRRSEISKIKVSDIDLESGYIRINGKGDKDRVVPLSKRVCELVNNYTMCIRPEFIRDDKKDPEYLILNRWGQQMDPNGIWAVVKRCVHLSGIKKNISTHTFRHTCATHMLKNGAPVRHIQEMLGHDSLESTQIYTHVTINDLKEIHARYHPSDSINI